MRSPRRRRFLELITRLYVGTIPPLKTLSVDRILALQYIPTSTYSTCIRSFPMHFRFTYASRLSVLVAVFAFHIHAQAVSGSTNAPSAMWSSQNVQHAYGLPQAKPNDKGTLTVTSEGVSFTGKAERFTIQRPSVIAVSAGNQRVELWGMKGRLLRMAIPDGGGLAAAGVMQHRVDTLTVEFSDSKGGYHGAVFLLPANEAERAV